MTSKVVNMAPCSDKKEENKEVIIMEGRKGEIRLIIRLEREHGAQQKGNVKVLKNNSSFQVSLSLRDGGENGWMDCST